VLNEFLYNVFLVFSNAVYVIVILMCFLSIGRLTDIDLRNVLMCIDIDIDLFMFV